MTEWTVVTVLIALAGLFVTVAKPVLSLNNTITRLSENVERLEAQLTALSTHNSDVHRRLWERSDVHARRLEDHETRLTMLENK